MRGLDNLPSGTMSTSDDEDDVMLTTPQDEMREILLHKAKDLFALCDRESKGFASKVDMQRLQGELPLTPEQLDEVFDALDKDGNGYLTLEEFTDGFGMFLGIDTQPWNKITDADETENCRNNLPSEEILAEDNDDRFEDFLENLGAHNVFKDEDYIHQMWDHVRKDDPVMLNNFEEFLCKVTQELKNSKKEYSSLESTLKQRSNFHDEQVQLLYVEMEEQLESEKEQIMAQEKTKERKIRDELETELQLKDHQLQDLLLKHSQMEKQLEQLNSGDAETKHENAKLQKERDALEYRLAASERMLTDMQSHLLQLRRRSLDERRKRANAAFKISEGIALERESLVQQLETLKKVNKQLLDEKDELVLSATNTPLNGSDDDSPSSSIAGHRPYSVSPEKGLCASDPLSKTPSPRALINSEREERCLSELVNTMDPLSSPRSPKFEEDCEVDDSFFENNPHFLGLPPKELTFLQNNLNVTPDKKINTCTRQSAPDDSDEDDTTEYKLHPSTKPSSGNRSQKTRRPQSLALQASSASKDKSPSSSVATSNHVANESKKPDLTTPERLFKVVFIGDSGVGKSSFIHRFCHNTFRPTFSATIGVDFQVKTVNVEGRVVALQLWDTAGQERFRSLTKQYFRKADGIVIVYDVTSEMSFKSVRNWITQVKEGADENSVIMLIGNKTDLCKCDDDRVVKTKDGSWLADEFGTLFYETSAKSGSSVNEAINALATVLQEKEDEVIERVFRLQEEIKQKRKCC